MPIPFTADLRWCVCVCVLLPHICRYERSGTMHGLFRVRGFTQDDAHIFCLPDQIAPEIRGVLDLVEVRGVLLIHRQIVRFYRGGDSFEA